MPRASPGTAWNVGAIRTLAPSRHNFLVSCLTIFLFESFYYLCTMKVASSWVTQHQSDRKKAALPIAASKLSCHSHFVVVLKRRSRCDYAPVSHPSVTREMLERCSLWHLSWYFPFVLHAKRHQGSLWTCLVVALVGIPMLRSNAKTVSQANVNAGF